MTHDECKQVSNFLLQLCINSPSKLSTLRATSHMSQEPRPWNCESPNESVQRPSQHTSKIMSCDQGSSSVVWSHMWWGPHLNVFPMNFHSCGSSHMIKLDKSRVVSIRSAISSHPAPAGWMHSSHHTSNQPDGSSSILVGWAAHIRTGGHRLG